MVSDQLLEILRCPKDHSPLERADAAQIERINALVQAKQLTNLGGEQVERRLDGGLVRAAGDLLYPVIDRIPVMLPDEAIDLSQIKP